MRRFALLLILLVGLTAIGVSLAYNGGLRARVPFPPSAAPAPAVTNLAPRCYDVTFSFTDEGFPQFWRTRRRIRLEPTPHRKDTDGAGWYQARIVPHEDLNPTVLWVPIGVDSLDVQFGGWPIAIHARLASVDSVQAGRSALFDDAGSSWLPRGTSDLRRAPCDSMPARPRSNEEL